MDWQIKVAMNEYRDRVERALRDYDMKQAIKANQAEDSAFDLSTLIGRLLVSMGRKLQRWGVTLTNSPRAQIR